MFYFLLLSLIYSPWYKRKRFLFDAGSAVLFIILIVLLATFLALHKHGLQSPTLTAGSK
jgi:hypothetical protein